MSLAETQHGTIICLHLSAIDSLVIRVTGKSVVRPTYADYMLKETKLLGKHMSKDMDSDLVFGCT